MIAQKKRGRPRKIVAEEPIKKPVKSTGKTPKTNSRQELIRREKDLFLEIKRRLSSGRYWIEHSTYGMMIVKTTMDVKVPGELPFTSFGMPVDKKKKIITVFMIVWHEGQDFLSELFNNNTQYYWLWNNGVEIIKIENWEDIQNKLGNF